MARKTTMSDGATEVYEGGGTANALLTGKTTSALLVAANAELMQTGYCDTLELWPMCETAAQECVLVVGEFALEQVSVANMIRLRSVPVGSSEQGVTADRAVWSLTTGTERAAKVPIRIRVRRGTYVKIALFGAGTWYLRITAYKSANGDPVVDA